jgi:hypothetical protein
MDKTYLRECFVYDEVTGDLVWRERPRAHFRGGAGWHNFNRQFAGRPAGHKDEKGRKQVKLNGRSYKAARLIWAWHDGLMGEHQIDHIDGDPGNDRIDNLRLATAAQNARNRNASCRNSSGVRNVTWHAQSEKWWVRLTISGKTISLGLYKDLDTAKRIAAEKRRALFGDFARA